MSALAIMSMRALVLLLPDSLLGLLVVALGVGCVLGFVRAHTVVGLGMFLLLLPMLAPLIGVVLDSLPWWLVILLMLGLFVSLLRAAMELVVGRRAADHMVGILAAHSVRAVVSGAAGLAFRAIRGRGKTHSAGSDDQGTRAVAERRKTYRGHAHPPSTGARVLAGPLASGEVRKQARVQSPSLRTVPRGLPSGS